MSFYESKKYGVENLLFTFLQEPTVDVYNLGKQRDKKLPNTKLYPKHQRFMDVLSAKCDFHGVFPPRNTCFSFPN